jgi:hypothetical protein
VDATVQHRPRSTHPTNQHLAWHPPGHCDIHALSAYVHECSEIHPTIAGQSTHIYPPKGSQTRLPLRMSQH